MRKLAVVAVFLGLIVPATSFAEDPPGSIDVPSSTPTVPASLTLKLYRYGLSLSPTCENMTIYDIEKPDFVDFTKSPELGSANVPKGTYPCVALEIDKVISCTPSQTAGTCITGQLSSSDTCEGLATSAKLEAENPLPPGSYKFDGVQPLGGDASQAWVTCKPDGDRIAIYLTTQVPLGARNANPGRPPQSASDQLHGYNLASPLVVGDHTTGTLFVTSHATSYDNGCFCESPIFSFETTN